jgi:hypothetical protein
MPANDTTKMKIPMIMTGHSRKRTHTVSCCFASQMPTPMIGSDNTSVMKFNSPDQKLLHPIATEEEEEEAEEPRLFVQLEK